jgi:hypothetical protein
MGVGGTNKRGLITKSPYCNYFVTIFSKTLPILSNSYQHQEKRKALEIKETILKIKGL